MGTLATILALIVKAVCFWRSEQTPLKAEEHDEELLRKQAADMQQPSTDYNADTSELRK